jgi:hypothetical protein
MASKLASKLANIKHPKFMTDARLEDMDKVLLVGLWVVFWVRDCLELWDDVLS